PDDGSQLYFIWHEWIQAHGPLTAESAFEYFTNSQFYDKQSNNQVLRMQTMHTGQLLENEAEELRRFTGIEFALTHAEPPSLFIIHKRERLSPDEVRPLAVYFILNNRIYQAPDVYSLVSIRLLASLHALQSSLDVLRAHRPAYTPRTGFVWPIVEPSSGDGAGKKRAQDGEAALETPEHESVPGARGLASSASASASASGGAKRQQNSMLLLHAITTTNTHAQQSFQLPAVPSEDTVPETPAPAPRARSSVTPAPAAGLAAAGAPSVAPTPQEPTKGPPGGGKKKKKRELRHRVPAHSHFNAPSSRRRDGDASTT
ncbi:MED6-domain-containing protein, partial [Epithele typhae]